MSGSPEDRRRYPRVRAEVPVHLRQLAPGDLEGPVKTHQLGPRGCSVLVAEPVGVGATVEVMLDLKSEYLTVLGEVVYELPLPSGEFESGIQFLLLTPEQEGHLLAVVEEETAHP